MTSWCCVYAFSKSFNKLTGFIHFWTTTVERMHASCLGDGRNWTHTVRIKWDRTPLSPSANLAKGANKSFNTYFPTATNNIFITFRIINFTFKIVVSVKNTTYNSPIAVAFQCILLLKYYKFIKRTEDSFENFELFYHHIHNKFMDFLFSCVHLD